MFQAEWWGHAGKQKAPSIHSPRRELLQQAAKKKTETGALHWLGEKETHIAEF